MMTCAYCPNSCENHEECNKKLLLILDLITIRMKDEGNMEDDEEATILRDGEPGGLKKDSNDDIS